MVALCWTQGAAGLPTNTSNADIRGCGLAKTSAHVHHAVRARICIERGRYWQAEYWISDALLTALRAAIDGLLQEASDLQESVAKVEPRLREMMQR